MLSSADLQKLKNSLFSGKYNLLLGAGVSLDSFDKLGAALPSGWGLHKEICGIKGVSTDRPFTKVHQLLDAKEKDELLTKRFSETIPGKTLLEIPNFLWKQIFTFNIDDALEAAYENHDSSKQIGKPINYDEPYLTATSHSEVGIVHLHGYSRLPDSGYVFALTEYAKNSQSLNPWMTVLSQTLATESFIIAGTSLTEPDLEYYLSHRSEKTVRIDRGPSILVEPNPDAVTRNDCVRHGLVLVEATLEEFLRWLKLELGEPPTLETVVLPSIDGIFSKEVAPVSKISFFSSVELIQPVASAKGDGSTSGFYFGQQVTWQDLEAEIDIATPDVVRLIPKIKFFLGGGAAPHRAIVVVDEPGTGKTTVIRRAAYDLGSEGHVIFYLKPHAVVHYDDVLTCLRAVTNKCILFIDGAAENVGLIRLILEKNDLEDKVLIVCGERDYRKAHVDSNLENFNVEYFYLEQWKKPRFEQIIERYRQVGLLASTDAIKDPKGAANKLEGDSVAIASCRLMNNFRPFEQILDSIWKHSTDSAKRSFLTAALAEYCVPVGVKYSILQSAQINPDLQDQISYAHPLPLCFFDDDDDYVLPLNATLGERTLILASQNSPELMLDVFVNLANALAPFVNRRTTRERTAEARLAGRLFHVEEVVTRHLRDNAEVFYTRVKKNWEWNARYWEHRALELSARNLTTAVQYARHAVAIEQHPFPWTTLASLLIRQMNGDVGKRDHIYQEAFDLLIKALDYDVVRLRRHSRHAYLALFKGTERYLELGGILSDVTKGEIRSRIADASTLLRKNAKVVNSIAQLTAKLR